MANAKTYPEVGTPLYLANWYCSTKDPYTVIAVESGRVIVQAARCIFYGRRYFNTLADDIVADPNGRVISLNYAPKRGEWKESGKYGRTAVFGRYAYEPYLD